MVSHLDLVCTKCGSNPQLRMRTVCRGCWNEYQRSYHAETYYKRRGSLLAASKEKYATDQEFFDKNAARRKAIRTHHMSQLCSNCGSTDNVERHHDDYTKPLDIRWLCRSCHKDHHKGDTQ